ncbi:MAG: hypothetical protein KDC45_09430 [Bacteroidetes bacterium]|nr:hypothetical protein [Bacteroidota bacterium]
MKRHCVWIFFLIALGCRPTPFADPSFRLQVLISNPEQSFKVALVVLPAIDHQGQALISIARSNTGQMVHHEPGRVRRRLGDSLALEERMFSKLLALINSSGSWTNGDVMGERTTGTRFEIELSEMNRRNKYTVMGRTEQGVEKLPEFVLELFQTLFDSVRVAQDDLQISLNKVSYLNDKPDSSLVVVWKQGTVVLKNRLPVGWDAFCRFYQVLEDNDVWLLPDQKDFQNRYPVTYTVEISNGDRKHRWQVFAPSQLKDQRYFRIINAIETMSLGHGTDPN